MGAVRQHLRKAVARPRLFLFAAPQRRLEALGLSMTFLPNPFLNDSPLHLLHRACQRAGDLFSREMAKGGLTMRQFAVLATVAREQGLRQTDLVDLTGIDRSTLADIVQRLVERGLLERIRTKQDGRAYAVNLTDQGRTVLTNAEPAIIRAEAKLLSALGDGRQEFLRALKTLAAADAGELGRDSSPELRVVTPGDGAAL